MYVLSDRVFYAKTTCSLKASKHGGSMLEHYVFTLRWQYRSHLAILCCSLQMRVVNGDQYPEVGENYIKNYSVLIYTNNHASDELTCLLLSMYQHSGACFFMINIGLRNICAAFPCRKLLQPCSVSVLSPISSVKDIHCLFLVCFSRHLLSNCPCCKHKRKSIREASFPIARIYHN